MNRPKLILLVGIPGSGKTTYARKYAEKELNTVHLSSDAIRKELYGDESIQDNPGAVFVLMHQRAVEALNEGRNVIYDATNVTRKGRSTIINICPKFVNIEVHIIWAPIEVCIERDSTRERTVGKAVIDKMLKSFQAPYYDEGIDEIKIILPEKFNIAKYHDNVIFAMKIPHDNPHHTLDVYNHCMEAYEEVCCSSIDSDVRIAALYHDIGKPYVKAFIDSKGNSCEYAHYYQHQCLSVWMSYGLPNITPDIAWLISTHMDPYLNTKYYRSLPAYLKRDIDILHKADLASH